MPTVKSHDIRVNFRFSSSSIVGTQVFGQVIVGSQVFGQGIVGSQVFGQGIVGTQVLGQGIVDTRVPGQVIVGTRVSGQFGLATLLTHVGRFNPTNNVQYVGSTIADCSITSMNDKCMDFFTAHN